MNKLLLTQDGLTRFLTGEAEESVKVTSAKTKLGRNLFFLFFFPFFLSSFVGNK